jgi:ADP-ribose pyrophosphatase
VADERQRGGRVTEPAKPGAYELVKTETLYEGRIITLVKDTVAMPEGGDSVREVVRHIGAVCIAAVDDEGRVVMVRQYRHPVGGYLWELPAGLRDADGEPPLETAKRELAEEAGLSAERWSLLVTSYSTPGFCDEQVLIYLAEGLSDAERPEGFTAEHEETDMTVARVPLEEAVGRIFTGGIRNASAVIGLLAAARARETSPELRPVDAE